jgi:hypothetical protein
MSVKHLFSILLSFSVANTVFAEESSIQWHLLGKGKINGVSGIAVVDDEHFIVVHDRKKPNEPRLGIVTWKKNETPSLAPLPWCDADNLPTDLEAITAVPNYPKQYLVLESKGKVTRIQLADNNACKITANFDLPALTSDTNMESLALHCIKEDCVIAWAERGDEKTAAKFSWASFDINKNELEDSNVKSFDFKASYPKANQRSISDMAINAKGDVWVSAASDPSDVGTFYSAIYNLGTFVQHDNQIIWQAAKEESLVAKYDRDNVKIEGLTFTPTALIMGSEDEILGGKIAAKPLK